AATDTRRTLKRGDDSMGNQVETGREFRRAVLLAGGATATSKTSGLSGQPARGRGSAVRDWPGPRCLSAMPQSPNGKFAREPRRRELPASRPHSDSRPYGPGGTVGADRRPPGSHNRRGEAT